MNEKLQQIDDLLTSLDQQTKYIRQQAQNIDREINYDVKGRIFDYCLELEIPESVKDFLESSLKRKLVEKVEVMKFNVRSW